MAASLLSRRARDAARFVVSGSRVMLRGTYGLAHVARSGGLAESLRPWLRFTRVEDVPFELLAQQGVKAVLFDLENTLVPPGGPFVPEARDVLERARNAGLAAAVVTNSSARWARRALEAEALPHVVGAGKPGRDAFLTACRLLGVKPSEAAFVGDQVITDVFGAQRAGIRAVLLEPRWERESASSRFQRFVTRSLLRAGGRG